MTNKLIAPSTDFRAVRDGRNSQVFYVDIALDTARSAAAGTGLVLPISGNSFYCDANPTDGNAFVHFQDTNFDRGPVPLYVSPGTIFNIPYTKILLENSAQPGKKIRIAYGIDVDFQPGSVAQISIAGNVISQSLTYSRGALGQAFNVFISGTGNATQLPFVGLLNPVGSGKTIEVSGITGLHTFAGSEQIAVGRSIASNVLTGLSILAAAAVGNTNKALNGANPVARQIAPDGTATAIGNNSFNYTVFRGQNSEFLYRAETPHVVPPGHYVFVSLLGAAAKSVAGNFEWTEY